MNYNDALEYIHSFLKFGSKLGLDRIELLLDKLGNPQDKLRIVHVAGTNGKGSVCTMLSEMLISAGYKTGLYTSPYVVDFCERIQINGAMIAHETLTSCVAELKPVIAELNEEGIEITEFEIVTALAFLYFARQKCDIVLLEVGLGGIYDATNVIKHPLITVITSISKDHTAILGDTYTEIAENKCGILKAHAVTVSYPIQNEDAMVVLRRTADEKKNSLIIPDLNCLSETKVETAGSRFMYRNHDYTLSLSGAHQIYNALTAIETAGVLQDMGFAIRQTDVENGIRNAFAPARAERIRDNPPVLLDGGHNEEGAKAFSEVLRRYPSAICVISMMRDKDVESAVRHIARTCRCMFTVQCSNPRAMAADALKAVCDKYCEHVIAADTIYEAVDRALLEQKDGEAVAVCGSLYLAGDIRAYLVEKAKNINE